MAASLSQDLEQLDQGLVVFRYTDLPAELQQIILEDAIVVTQEGGEKLSRLAVVSREWQKRVEEITFARLGEDPGTNIASPFRAMHLRTFEHVVTGTRRANLRSIVLDFDLDEEGMPELQGSPPASADEQTLIHATRVRRCHRFTDYMREVFRILHAWDATQVGRPHLRLKIRVYGEQLEHMMTHDHLPGDTLREDFTGLPHVSSVSSFELTNPNDRTRCDHGYYVPPGSINEILSRLPRLNAAAIHTTVPYGLSYVSLVQTIGGHGEDWANLNGTLREHGRALDALVDLPVTIPTTFKKLVLKNSDMLVGKIMWILQGMAQSRNEGGVGEDLPAIDDPFKSVCALGRRLESLFISYVFKVDYFLDFALKSHLDSPWLIMRELFVIGYSSDADSQSESDDPDRGRCLDLTRKLIAQMPVVEKIYVKLTAGLKIPQRPIEADWPTVEVNLEVKAEYVKTTNRDDHVLLAVRPRALLTAQLIKSWERAIQKGRGVPLRIFEVEEVPQPQQEEAVSEAESEGDDTDA